MKTGIVLSREDLALLQRGRTLPFCFRAGSENVELALILEGARPPRPAAQPPPMHEDVAEARGLLTTRQIAAKVGVSPSYISKLVKEGRVRRAGIVHVGPRRMISAAFHPDEVARCRKIIKKGR